MLRRDSVVILLILLLVIAMAQPNPEAQSKSWEALLGEAQNLSGEGQADAAKKAYQAALKVAEGEAGGAVAVATVLAKAASSTVGRSSTRRLRKASSEQCGWLSLNPPLESTAALNCTVLSRTYTSISGRETRLSDSCFRHGTN
jgi:hypothetical protein